MKMAELSLTSGVSPATIKWNLRIGLLPKGASSARNQAEYGMSHVYRLRLVRALLEVGGFSVAQVQSVIASIDNPDIPLDEVVKAVHDALSSRRANEGNPVVLEYVDAFIKHRGWKVDVDTPARADLAAAISAMIELSAVNEPAVIDEAESYSKAVEAAIFQGLDPYAAAVEKLAQAEIANLPNQTQIAGLLKDDSPAVLRDVLVQQIVVGTVLMERSIGALRRLAQAHYFLNQPVT
jgi:DNA-binding transcriptional MerR regulator